MQGVNRAAVLAWFSVFLFFFGGWLGVMKKKSRREEGKEEWRKGW